MARRDDKLGGRNDENVKRGSAAEVDDTAWRTKAEEEREPDCLLLFFLCAVSALEGADTALLPSAMKALQVDVGFKLTDIAYLNVAQAVCTNLAAPLWGILADRGVLRRKSILIIGALGQGIVTTILAFSTTLWPMIVLRAIEGALLAALRPISNGIIADVTSDSRRGKIFGRVQSSLLCGMFVSTTVAINMANKRILGVQGWRVAFVLVGILAACVALLVAMLMQEPPHANNATSARGFQAVVEELRDLLRFCMIPTFCVMIMQGIFGTIPWTVMGNMALFFQLTGMKDEKVSVLSGEFTIAGAVGNLLGGYVADALARAFGLHGRPLNAQITVALGIPMIYFMYQGVPPGKGTFVGYFFLIAGFGLLGSWAQSGTNFPVLSEIVPASSRSRVMAWELALENSIANALGPPVVALLATKCFGYTFGKEKAEGRDIASAQALGQAMAVVICIPWVVCFAAYTLLHWSYPRDVRRLHAKAEAATDGSVSVEPAAGPAVEGVADV